jgi:hypothetical protein
MTGIIDDLKRRVPFYWSDYKDGRLNYLHCSNDNTKMQHLLLYPHHKMWGGGAIMDLLCRVGRLVCPSPFSCPLYNSCTNWRIFFKLGSNVHLNKRLCRTHVAHVSAQGQGHNWRSNIKHNQILDSMSCPLCKSYNNWKIFFKLGSNVHLNKGMCRTYVAHVSAQGQGHNWRSNIKQSNIGQYVVSAL